MQGLRTRPARNTTAISSYSNTAATSADSDWENLGAVLFNWDMFCAFSTAAVAATGGFDSGVHWGKLDYDYLRRIELQGASTGHARKAVDLSPCQVFGT